MQYICTQKKVSNINQIIRYKIIDSCLRRKGRKYNWKDLAEACADAFDENGIIAATPSRRTIMGDISRMRSGILGYEAPIIYKKAEDIYLYEDSNFSISGNTLTNGDLHELRSALTILKQFNGIQVEEIEQIVTKIEDTLLRKEKNEPDSVIRFDRTQNLKGLDFLPILHRHTLNKQVLRIQYQPFDKAVSTILISPYLLKEYNKRWYLIGYNHKKATIQNLALDRIIKVDTELIEKFTLVSYFDKEYYFRSIIGVSRNEEVGIQKIVIETTPLQANYIKTKPIHESQNLEEETPTKSVFSYKLIPNFELESQLLSYGEHIKILAPESLKFKMKARYRKMASGE